MYQAAPLTLYSFAYCSDNMSWLSMTPMLLHSDARMFQLSNCLTITSRHMAPTSTRTTSVLRYLKQHTQHASRKLDSRLLQPMLFHSRAYQYLRLPTKAHWNTRLSPMDTFPAKIERQVLPHWQEYTAIAHCHRFRSIATACGAEERLRSKSGPSSTALNLQAICNTAAELRNYHIRQRTVLWARRPKRESSWFVAKPHQSTNAKGAAKPKQKSLSSHSSTQPFHTKINSCSY